MNNPKRNKGIRPRSVNTRDTIPKFLIVCEGERTEPNYFKSFRVPTQPNIIRIDIYGTGYNTVSLVNEAIRKHNEDGSYDQVWCVFDKDSFPDEDFNKAIHLAKAQNFYVAYSNEAFELWYLLHFIYCDAAISRSTYSERLNQYLLTPYKKNNREMYAILHDYQPTAITNASKLLNNYNNHNPAKDNPCTTVHHLVQELNKYIR